MGVSQIVYGTDIPFNWPVGVDLVLRASFLGDADREAILGGNAARLLRWRRRDRSERLKSDVLKRTHDGTKR